MGYLGQKMRDRIATYFVWDGLSPFVKIGKSMRGSLEARIHDLGCGNPNPLRLIGIVNGDRERDIHSHFHRLRKHREWFSLDERIITFIENHCIPTDFLTQEACRMRLVITGHSAPDAIVAQNGIQELASAEEWIGRGYFGPSAIAPPVVWRVSDLAPGLVCERELCDTMRMSSGDLLSCIKGRLPMPNAIPDSLVWKRDEVDAWIESCMTGGSVNK